MAEASSSFGTRQVVALAIIAVVIGFAVWGSRSAKQGNAAPPAEPAKSAVTDILPGSDAGTKDAAGKAAPPAGSTKSAVTDGLPGSDAGTKDADGKKAVTGVDETATALASKLTGRWQRYGDPYVIEIRSVKPDGKLDAGYFNPNPINVSEAKYSMNEGKLFVFVELRDTNYPGATYKLSYDPVNDRLNGFYHQPINDQTYEIFFVRQQE